MHVELAVPALFPTVEALQDAFDRLRPPTLELIVARGRIVRRRIAQPFDLGMQQTVPPRFLRPQAKAPLTAHHDSQQPVGALVPVDNARQRSSLEPLGDGKGISIKTAPRKSSL